MTRETTEPKSDGLRLVGYFSKKTAVPAGWSTSATSAHVTEICSVSGCVATPPEGWIDHRLHNEWGFFNTQLDAELVVPSGCDGFTVFAYRLLAVQFAHGRSKRLAIGDLSVEPMPYGFMSLGFDVVNKTVSAFFECSPLSCNGMANEVAVNRFCLVEDLVEAIALADRFSRDEPEPGPYYVLDVLRAHA
jgi:hypothetical protein